jgi:IS1 family transposase
MANHLPLEKKALVLSLLSEGNSIRSIERMSGVHRDTIMRLMVAVAERCEAFMDETMVNLTVNKLQCDEIWCFVAKKQKRVEENEDDRYIGDQYCFVAMDSETKLIPAFMLGKRSPETTRFFMRRVYNCVTVTMQMSTDSFPPYRDIVDRLWGATINYGQVNKQYQEAEGEKRYSPGSIISVTRKRILGHPNRKDISTSHVERQNLTMRMGMRRFTRLTNAYSKKWQNLKAALTLYFWHYNFARVHESLRVTPAIEHGIAGHIWTWYDLLNWQEKAVAA